MTAKLANLGSFDRVMKDYYPRPGERIKQYVVDDLREVKWERETCPRFGSLPPHQDNCGDECRNGCGEVSWLELVNHSDCDQCNQMAEDKATTPEVIAWKAERAERPPTCTDHDKLSDEIAPDMSLRENPLFKMLRKP